MNQISFDQMRAAMVDSQLRVNGVNDSEIVAAIAAVPRERFVPHDKALLAYVDDDLPIAPGRALMNPRAFGQLLVQLRIAPEERVLIIGAGTGYSAAVIARLAREVVAVEQDPALVAAAQTALAGQGVGNVAVVEHVLSAGWPAGSPYDVLFFDGAVERIPQPLLDQLRDGGRVAGVVYGEDGVGRGTIGMVTGGVLGVTEFSDLNALRLPGFERPRGFRF